MKIVKLRHAPNFYVDATVNINNGLPIVELHIDRILDALSVLPAQSETVTDHQPLITHEDPTPRIVGCSCGWRVPSGATDSDDAIAAHVAAHTVVPR